MHMCAVDKTARDGTVFPGWHRVPGMHRKMPFTLRLHTLNVFISLPDASGKYPEKKQLKLLRVYLNSQGPVHHNEDVKVAAHTAESMLVPSPAQGRSY